MLAKEMLAAAEIIVGPLPNCKAVCFKPAQTVDELIKLMGEAIREVDQGKGVLILTDLFGGTPANISLSFQGPKIEVVCGITRVPEIPVRRQKLNSGEAPLSRAGELMRLPKGPAHVKRIGHGVLMTPRFRETVGWFRETLGFVCSDDVYVENKDNIIGSFNRCDRGDRYVDHHVFFCLAHAKTGLNHLSFEVPDIDDVCMGHDYLKQFGKYEHMWGIGRHVLGSQVYDYWADPWGRVHEHWADSDRLNLANGSNLVSADEALLSQWGEAPPEKFINHASP